MLDLIDDTQAWHLHPMPIHRTMVILASKLLNWEKFYERITQWTE